jgi:thioredoxin reductase (NADPH)
MLMARPLLLVVDDDPQALQAVESQLADRYSVDYQVEGVLGVGEALRRLSDASGVRAEVAAVLAAQPLSGETAQLLDSVRELYPRAKRALVIPSRSWTDARLASAIRALMALGRIDYFLVRPAGPRDEVFHEAMADVLLEWAKEQRIVPDTVHIVGEESSGRASELKDVFESCAVSHSFCLAESDEGRDLLARVGPDAKLPLMFLPDGRVLSDPSNDEIAEAAGAPSDFELHPFDLVIVGAGPAGLSAAVYGASEGLDVVVVDARGIGGQARSSSLIRNYLGFARGVTGRRLAEQAYEQAQVFGADFVFMHRATSLERSDGHLHLSLEDGRAVSGRAVILATGATYRRLGVASLEELTGTGVFYGAAASEAPALLGREVFIAGGGNSAGQAALYLARYARHVTLIIRAQSLKAGMSEYLVQAVTAAPNVEVRTGTEVVGGGGHGRLQHLVLRKRETNDEESVTADALFVMIGARPQTEWLPATIATDEHGFLLTGEDAVRGQRHLERRPLDLETSMPGVFAIGDVRHASVKRVASAVGEGSVALRLVHDFFEHEARMGRQPEAAILASRST